MGDLSRFFKPSVLELVPYSSARDEYRGEEGLFLDANENRHDFAYNRYPDPYQSELKWAIAHWRCISSGNVFLGNGSDEIIHLLIRATCQMGKDRILTLDPSYGMYRVSAKINEIPLDVVAMNPDFSVNQEDLFGKLNENHKLIFICSPNNPNGGIIDRELIEQILDQASGLVVIDEAYIDFADTPSWLRRIRTYDNLVVMQTFSKSLGAAGIRIGMAIMRPRMAFFLNKIKPPYNISIPNQKAALQRLKEMDQVKIAIQNIKKERLRLHAKLEEMTIVENVFPSEANFLLVRFKNAKKVYWALLNQKIIVRDRSSQQWCDECLRITIGTKAENDILLEAIQKMESDI